MSGNVRQTLMNEYVSGHKHLDLFYERHFLNMEDGGTISVDWLMPEEKPAGKRKVCVIFPGLSGGSERGYVKICAKVLIKEGYEVAVLHPRGFGNTEYTSTCFQSMSSNEEFIKGLNFIKSHAKDADLVGIGMSAGACHMCRVAGDMKDDFPLKAMVSVNNPFDLWSTINLMRGKVYE